MAFILIPATNFNQLDGTIALDQIPDALITDVKLALESQDQFQPIGSVVAWHKSFANTPALPDTWLECNGQVVSDAESPYDGQTIPDLNASSGTERFLRGQVTSGGTGGSETHTHTQTDPGNFVDGGQASCLGADEGARNNSATSTTSTLPSYFEVVWIIKIKRGL